MFCNLKSKINRIFEDETNTATRMFDFVGWPPGEIRLGQEESFLTWLRGVVSDHGAVVPHLLDCCLNDLVLKFRLICKVMAETEEGIDLSLEKGISMFIFATAKKSKKVCEVIISVATREQLVVTANALPGLEGCSILHFMVVNNMADLMCKYLDKLDAVDRKVMFNTHITGKHFLVKMQTSSLPLHLACLSGNEDIVRLLLSYGAELDARDMKGNTVLHILVGKRASEDTELAKKMFKVVLTSDESKVWYCQKKDQDQNHWTTENGIALKKHMLYIENDDGYTPLTWAAKIMNKDLLDFILNIEGVYRETAWYFGQSAFVLYEMTEVDPVISHHMRKVKPNVLDLLTYRLASDGDLSCFSIPVMEQLINYKWKIHRYNMTFWCIWHVAVMVMCFKFPKIIFTQLKPADTNSTSSTEFGGYEKGALDLIWKSNSLKAMVFFLTFSLFSDMLLEMIVVGQSIIHFLFVMTRKWHGKSYKAPFMVIFKADTFQVINTMFNICQILSSIKIVMYSEMTVYTAISFISGCYFLMFFLQGFQMTGYFVTLMHLVIFTDIVSFGVVFGLMLMGFGGTMSMIINNPLRVIPGYENLKDSTYTMFKLMAGLGSIDTSDYDYNRDIITIVFVLFVCVMMILLLNMLIAAMSETYAKFTQHRSEICLRNRASMMTRYEICSLIVKVKFKLGKYLAYNKDKDHYELMVETTSPATCV